MRFARTAISMALLAFMSPAHADQTTAPATTTAKHHHKITLPQSYTALLKSQDKSGFAVSQPLLVSGASQQTGLALHPAIETVLASTKQGYYPMSEAKSEGFNFVGMTRQVPDITRSASTAADTAGLMSWTGKFN